MNILFLCTANLHRSKTAEEFFNTLESNHTFQSAGLSEKYCKKYGSRLCTVELLNWAELIFVMEPMHQKRIVEYAGDHYSDKITVLNIDDIYQYMQPALLAELKSNVHLQFINK